MEPNEKLKYLSPLISKNTPIKRLGLSRKRKSPSVDNQSNKLYAKNPGDSPLTTSFAPTHEKKENKSHTDVTSKDTQESSFNDDSIESLKKRIEEKEKNLKLLKESSNNSEIKELEDLYQLWKNGCKNALMHLLSLLKEKQPEFNNVEKVSEKLGIWEIIENNFQDDLDFLAYEE